MLVTAWDAVTTKTVVNRFGMSKILNETQKAIIAEEDDSFEKLRINPVGNCMFKVNERNTRTSCEICSKLTIKIP